MADWDWSSSNIGSGSSGGFSGDDYYWTGGKFTDWSGKSAGKFGSGSGYSSSDSNEALGVPTRVISQERKKEWIENEKRHGLHNDTDELPKFLSTGGLCVWTIFFLLIQMTMILPMMVFFKFPDKTEPMIISGLWVLATIVTTWYLCTRVKDWYPAPYRLTKVKLARFLLYQDLVKIGSSMICLFFVLTPLWRYLADGYIEAINEEKYGEFFYQYIHFHLDTSHIIGMIILGLIALMPFFSVLLWPLSTKRVLEGRWEYMRYKMGLLNEVEKTRLEKTAELEKQLEEKKKEIAALMSQIIALKNRNNV